MNLASTALIAFAMSTDAFAAAIGKGAALHRPHWREALRTGLVFGVIEGLTPVVGWALGVAAAPYVEAWDHWIAFALLGALGLHMIRAGLAHDDVDAPAERPQSHSLRRLAVTGFATSIDAMAIGVGIALIDADIVVTAVSIGLATLVMVTLGVMLGRMLGAIVGRRAEVAGGLVLIGIGTAILWQHLSGAA
jgi:putative Mn2+ efflux pump MntP